jgi:hypothetical protein
MGMEEMVTKEKESGKSMSIQRSAYSISKINACNREGETVLKINS